MHVFTFTLRPVVWSHFEIPKTRAS